MSFCGKNVGGDEQVQTCSRVEDDNLNVISSMEVIGNMECEQYMEGNITPKGTEKRRRPNSDVIEENDIDDGFITVRTRRSKRFARNITKHSDFHKSNNSNLEEQYQVSITSKEVLPKQIAFAKLLRAENITNILRIKFRSPFKVLIQFECKEHAEKLIQNKKLSDMGYRMQLVDEINVSYGIIKEIDLDEEEKELMENLQCDHEILAVKRLKRLSDGKWIDSETVRISFKSQTLPPYVYGFGCRFEVKAYMFPVTQCAKCWRFGHQTRLCPMKKIVCPKCCSDHENCETTEYKCVNCKNDHMANDKTCPIFLKEKMIRRIMLLENCTYRRALEIHRNSKNRNEEYDKSEYDKSGSECESTDQDDHTMKGTDFLKRTYRDILLTEATVHAEKSDTDDNMNNEEGSVANTIKSKNKKKKKKQSKTRPSNEDRFKQSSQDNEEQPNQHTENEASKECKNNIYEANFT
ncbi:uncharacterized protein LOC123872606 [Maniola jurtina]|uniref:uncharacterized protein LOC123872606 n=1 Tax=Maniola jurtina TaxID=191418 RepID=UPI001E688D96|nr:uncharacterized protein LOC123872606 [Maniola jurtina]